MIARHRIDHLLLDRYSGPDRILEYIDQIARQVHRLGEVPVSLTVEVGPPWPSDEDSEARRAGE